MAIASPRERVTRLDAWKTEERSVEEQVRNHEEILFVRQTGEGSWRILRLLEGGREVEAHQTAAYLMDKAHKRLRQLGLLDPEPAA